MIKISNVSKIFDGFTAVNDISLEIKQGEIFSLLGRNGAGKTVTVKMLTTQLVPTSGTITISGIDIVKEPNKVKRLIGVMPEMQNLYLRLTGYDNLLLFAELNNVCKSRVTELLNIFKLEKRAKEKVGSYSLGMKQRLLFARSILSKPAVLFLDEPTNALDPLAADFIRSIITELNQTGTTIVLTTHYIEEAELLSHRVAIIDNGKIVVCDSPENMKNHIREGKINIVLKNTGEKSLNISDINQLKNIISNDDIISLRIDKPNLRDAFISFTGEDIK
jgi:ABC-2 type transport system ATP-binding protein